MPKAHQPLQHLILILIFFKFSSSSISPFSSPPPSASSSLTFHARISIFLLIPTFIFGLLPSSFFIVILCVLVLSTSCWASLLPF